MDQRSLRHHLADLEPVVLADPQPDTWRILERTGRIACVVDSRAASGEAGCRSVLERLRNTLVGFPQPERQAPFRLHVHVRGEALTFPTLTRALVVLSNFVDPLAQTYVTLHLGTGFSDWDLVHSVVSGIREGTQPSQVMGFRVSAPFDSIADLDLEPLFDLGVRVRFAAGWLPGCARGEVCSVHPQALRRLSEFGFRTCVEWYTHANNVQAFEEVIPELLRSNFHSGFSLPLASRHPGYRFGPQDPPLPDAIEYCRLLTKAYRAYPYYDDAFFPLNALALLVNQGAWQPRLNLPSTVQILLDETDRVGVFRQAPALSRRWTTLTELTRTPQQELLEELRSLLPGPDQRQWHPYCADCSWRNICLGLDESDGPAPDRKILDVFCGHRKLFLEHFAMQRLPEGNFTSQNKEAQ